VRIKGTFHIHVNRQMIAMAAKRGLDNIPTMIVRPVKRGRPTWYVVGFTIVAMSGRAGGPGFMPRLDCGARTYFTVDAELILHKPMTFREARNLLKKASCKN
jgi:hypothetical protein